MNGLTQHTTRLLAALGLALASASVAPTPAAAQNDIRDIPPLVTLLVDTSSSMQRLGACECDTSTDPACRGCLPECTTGTPERNRWWTVVEALTGTFADFSCSVEDRDAPSYAGEPDYTDPIPHVRAGGIACLSNSDCPGALTCLSDGATQGLCQEEDGILDIYRERVRFGFMTFDTGDTFLSGPGINIENELVTRALYQSRIGEESTAMGTYSYGEARPFSFPGCGEPYMINNGVRTYRADGGSLISSGREGVDDLVTINQLIQESLLDPSLRPTGATPVAGMLEDLDFYFDNDPDVSPIRAGTLGSGDPFNACRARYAILLTDGAPNADMRDSTVNCEAMGNGVGELGCPYDTPVNTAARLVTEGDIQALYVVGFNVTADNCPSGVAGDRCRQNAADAIAELDAIADAGNTGSAIFADDRATLIAALATIIDESAPGTTSRTQPAFANTGSSTGAVNRQIQLNTGFNVSREAGEPWTGVLERRRFECDGLTVEEQPVLPTDRFQNVLNAQTGAPGSGSEPRRLLTVVAPTLPPFLDFYGDGQADLQARSPTPPLPPTGLPTNALQVGLDLQAFGLSNPALTPEVLGLDDPLLSGAEQLLALQNTFEWMQGLAGTARDGRRLGSIVHSSPVVVGPPSLDIADEDYNLFRERVGERPTVTYVGTNDGLMHAFLTEDYEVPATDPDFAGLNITAGTELWGFVPPVLLRQLPDVQDAPRAMVDATPVVRDVFDARLLGQIASGDAYRTVMVSGLRAGAPAFFALDVTDPFRPEFLWQYTDPGMLGETYGEPTLAQVRVEFGSVTHERGIAILPGGKGTQDLTLGGVDLDGDGTPETSPACSVPANAVGLTPERGEAGRTDRRCWMPDEGRALVILDLATGAVLRSWDAATFPAPLAGGVSAFPGDTGNIATRAFVTDEDGVIWRIDLSEPDPDDWEVSAFYDMFHGLGYAAGQPAFGPPVLSTDEDGNVVILHGTGDIDRLENPGVRNRIVSLTEQITFDDATGAVTDVGARLNWEITLDEGELVTGPLELFNGEVFFGTFTSTTDITNACEFGFSRIWGVQYIESEPAVSTDPAPALESTPGSGIQDVTNLGPGDSPGLDNRLVLGVSVTERPNCALRDEVSETDPYIGTRQTVRMRQVAPPTFELVAQLSGGPGGGGAGGGSVQEFNRELPPPVGYTTQRALLGIVD
ncbi:MAG: hypothetical protein AAF447_00275 [Myxococcota bacterium]